MSPGTGELDRLSAEDLLEIAAGILGEVTVRDPGALASAAARPWTTVLGRDAYPTLAAKAAALMHALARNHALLDGNKRLAWAATRVFCLLNGRDVKLPIDVAESMVVAVATGELDVPDLAVTLAEHLVTDPGPGGP